MIHIAFHKSVKMSLVNIKISMPELPFSAITSHFMSLSIRVIIFQNLAIYTAIPVIIRHKSDRPGGYGAFILVNVDNYINYIDSTN